MADNSKKIDFNDFLKIYPPLSKPEDKSNYKTFNQYFKKKEKKDINKDEEKKEIKIIEEKDENVNNLETDRTKDENEEEWYLIDKAIDLQNKKRKRTNDIRQALETFFNQSVLISKLSTFFHEFQSFLTTPEPPKKKNTQKDEKKEEHLKSFIKLPSFIKDKEIEEKILIKIKGITCKLTESVKIMKFGGNHYIIRMFEIGEQCYFLLSGRLSVLKPVEYKNVKITYEEYLIYLMTLYNNKEFDLIEQLIEINKKYINLHYLDNLIIFVKAYFIVKLNNDINNEDEITIKYIDKKFKDFYLSYEDFGLKRNEILYQINQIKYTSNAKDNKLNLEIKQYLLSIFKPSVDDRFIMNQYKFVFDKKLEKESPGCSLFKYEIFIFLYPGAFFGETALEIKNRKRNASIRTEEECIILSLSIEDYRNLLSDDNKRLKALDIALICNNFFFGNISPILFDKYYFPYFKALNKKKDDILYDQGDEISSVFLLKEGEVKFEINCSILDLYNIIRNYLLAIIRNNHFFQLSEEEIKKLKETYLNDSFYFNLRNKNEIFKEKLKVKRKMFLYRCNTYECFGLIEYFLDINYNMTCSVNSLKAKLFEINKYNLEKIISGEKQITSTYYQFVINQLLLQIKRLHNVKEDNINQIEYKIKEKIYDESKVMNYFIKGQTGIYKPFKKEKLKIKPLFLEDNSSNNQSNKVLSTIIPNKKLDNNINDLIKRKSYIFTEPNLMPSINTNKKDDLYKSLREKINDDKDVKNKIYNIKTNIKILKEDNNNKKYFLNKNITNSHLTFNKNRTSKTIVNCGREFLSLKQIKKKLMNLRKDMNEYNQLQSEVNISLNNNKEINLRSLYKNDVDINNQKFINDLVNKEDISKFSKYSLKPKSFYDSFGVNFKKYFKVKAIPSFTNRKKMWRNVKINIDDIENMKIKNKLMTTVSIQPIEIRRRGKSTMNNNTIIQ